MKPDRLILVFSLAFLLILGGCGGNQAAAPMATTQADGITSISLFSQLPKEVQVLGPAAIRAGVDTAMIIKPEIKGAVALACLGAWPIVKQGNIAMGMGQIMHQVQDVSKFAPVAVMLVSLVQEQMKYSLDSHDQEIFASLVKNIGIDAGLTTADFK